MRRIEVIVEGHGEQRAMPMLIRRIAAAVAPQQPISVGPGWRLAKGRILTDDHEVRRVLDILALQVKPVGGGILLVWDADDACPAESAPAQQHRVQSLRADLPVRVVIANREYESWFLAGAADLAGKAGLPADLADHPEPEKPRNAKGWLDQHLPAGISYKETIHQEQFSAHLDVARVRGRSPSFDKLCREVEGVLR
jgi:hypothetical protein